MAVIAGTPAPSRGPAVFENGLLGLLAFLAVVGLAVVVVAARGGAPATTTEPAVPARPVHESFGTDSPGLRDVPGAGAWTRTGGSWSTSAGVARVTHDRVRPVTAYVDAGTTDLSVEVVLPTPVPGAGLAFRVVDDRNFWLWAPALTRGSFTLVHVVDGFPRVIASSDPVGTVEGVVIGVHAHGPSLELLVNASVVLTAVDDAPAGTGAGLGVRAVTSSAATFDDLTITPA